MPDRPLLIYDGDCRFCKFWIQRWKNLTGDLVTYAEYQQVADQYPDVPLKSFMDAVQLIDTNGNRYSGAEAVYRVLAHNPNKRYLLKMYESLPGFDTFSNFIYFIVARFRWLFYWITKLFWGTHAHPPEYFLTRWIYLRSLGLIYFIAFVSLWTQIDGLIGSDGISPAEDLMQVVNNHFDNKDLGWSRYFRFPTITWLNASDKMLHLICASGTCFSLLLIVGVAPIPSLLMLWLLYLSLSQVSGIFLGYQWDILLLEAGFLAIFLAPRQFFPRISMASPPSWLIVWMHRWLLFRLMFRSGRVKLLSQDPAWSEGAALTFHYETQPITTWTAWYMHQLPDWFHKLCLNNMFFIELYVPFLFFLPRRIRIIACALQISLQLVVIATGNYTFFNWLTIAICFLLLDDNFFPLRLRNKFQRKIASSHLPTRQKIMVAVSVFLILILFLIKPDITVIFFLVFLVLIAFIPFLWWRKITIYTVATVLFFNSLISMKGVLITERGLHVTDNFAIPIHISLIMPIMKFTSDAWSSALGPLRLVNGYGLFAVMTTSRPEIIIQGSNDLKEWKNYELKWKSTDLGTRPRFVAPHQPRLDWQMWFASLGNFSGNNWFIKFCAKLLEGSQDVTDLMASNPFPDKPPRFLRCIIYDYHFTTIQERKETGNWWKRDNRKNYSPILELDDQGKLRMIQKRRRRRDSF